MRLVKILSVMLFTSVMFGCSTVNYNYEAKVDYFSKPALNEIVEVYVGDYMIDQGKSVTRDFLVLNRTIDGTLYDIHKGLYSRVGEHKGSSYFSPTTSKGQPISYAVGLVDSPVALHVNNKKELCVTSVSYQAAACYEGSFKIK